MALLQTIKSSKLVKSFGIYTIARIINSCIPFFILPVMTKYLSPADYGVISMITTIAAFVLPFVSINTDSAIVRKYYDKEEVISEYIGTCICLILVSCIVITVICYCSANHISIWLQVPPYVLCLIPLYCVFLFFKTIVLYSWQVKGEPLKYGIFSIIFTAIEISIALFAIIVLGMNWEGRAFSLFTAAFLATCFAIFNLSKRNMLRLCFVKEKANHAIKYGAGLIPHAVGGSLMVLANRFFLTNMVSIDETGLFGVATQLASLLSFITLSFNNAYVPWLYEKLSKKNNVENKRIVKITYLYFVLIFVIAVVSYFAILIIFPFFVNEQFSDAFKYIPLLLVGHVFEGFYYMVTNYIMYSGKTYFNGLSTIIAGIISVALNYIFIKCLGGVGASMAYATTYLVYFLMTWYISNKVYRMPWFSFNSK